MVLLNRKYLCILFLFCLLPVCSLAQDIPENYRQKNRVTMGSFGTVSSLCIYDDFNQSEALEKYVALWESIKALLEEMDFLLSTSIPTSEIARFNALPSGESMSVSELTANVFLLAQRMYVLTEGYYNPTVFPLVDLWGFSPRFTFGSDTRMPYDRERTDGMLPMPDQKYIDAFLKLADMDGIVLEGNADTGFVLRKNTPSVTIDGIVYHAQIDLGGIAKGYAADLVAEMMEDVGYEYGYFSCGSSSIRLLKSASFSAREAGDPSFQLQVRTPRETERQLEHYAYIRIKDCSLSSSGDYDNRYILDNVICSHIINPFTGYPLNYTKDSVQQGICTVTLLSGSAAEDDALTTALCLMGPQKAIDFINKNLREHSVIMVLYRADQSNYEVVTNLSQSDLRITDEAYHLASCIDQYGRIEYSGEILTF